MRLIDADELWEKMYRYNDNEGAKMPYGDDDSLIHKDSACFLIENAPTIEPERKTGEWIVSEGEEVGALGIKYRTYKCPFCGWENSLIIPRTFCPNCGAAMYIGEN